MSKSDTRDAQQQRAYHLLVTGQYREARELFEQLFDGHNPRLAAYLGDIYSMEESGEYDRMLAFAHYKVAAAGGHAHSQHALAGMLLEEGQEDEALKWYKCASEQGSAECSYLLASLLKRRGDSQASDFFLSRAADQGHVLAIQHLAVRHIVGRYGFRKIGTGLRMYFKNVRPLMRYARDNAGRHRPV